MKQSPPPITHNDLSDAELIQFILKRHEGKQAADGAIAVDTGKRTGRSPKDRFIVKDSLTANTVDWGAINQPIDVDIFNQLWNKAVQHLSTKESFVSHLRVGADPEHYLPVKVITELAWHNLFCKHLFIRTFDSSSDYAAGKPPWVILNASSLKTNPEQDGTPSDGVLIIDMSQRRILLCGMLYAGEMKKAMFTILNYFLPKEDVLPMHCAANASKEGDVALFFGLSGTGKTTLSADPERDLIGDDEHGWSSTGVFNFEGGCYAKCINLSQENEPMIWNAIRDGVIMENVVLNPQTNLPDYNDGSLTQNTRAAYPRENIPNIVKENRGDIAKSVIFLTCDLYGVLPPVAILNKEQAAYYFLSGYTALVGSTEMGSSAAITTTFSTCFGAPFFPRPAAVYADLLIKRIEESGCQVYLVNTGWTGGGYGQGGQRFSIPTTRAIIHAILKNQLNPQETLILPGFNIRIPKSIPGIDSRLLNPRETWINPKLHDTAAEELIKKFIENFKKFNVPAAIKNAGPEVK